MAKQKITRTVECPLPGFEGVTVTYDLMASREQVNTFSSDFQADTQGVVVEVTGWPEEYGAPFGEQTPLAFEIWARQRGITDAIKALAADPLS